MTLAYLENRLVALLLGTLNKANLLNLPRVHIVGYFRSIQSGRFVNIIIKLMNIGTYVAIVDELKIGQTNRPRCSKLGYTQRVVSLHCATGFNTNTFESSY